MKSEFKALLRRFLPRSIHKHRIFSGTLQGYTIVTSWHDYPAAITGRTERPLLDWFGRNVRPGETWLDVGAHYGYTAIALSRLVGPKGRVFAFEPMISTVGYLAQTRLLNSFPQMIVIPLALGMPEYIELRKLPTIRGMVDSTIQAGKYFERILIISLDKLWNQICEGNAKIDGIKIDVQGLEFEVLHGMFELLSRWKPKLVIEFHSGVDRTKLLDLIEAAGYRQRGEPIEPAPGEIEPQYVDNRSYAFQAF